jgi:hypothetical protein
MANFLRSKGPLPGATTVTRRHALSRNDHISWGGLPEGDGVALGFVDAPSGGKRYEGKTVAGRDYFITQPVHMLRLTQGENASWNGNFGPAQPIVCTDEGAAPMSIRIELPDLIRGAGVQFQARLMDTSSTLDFTAHLVLLGATPANFFEVWGNGRSSNGKDGRVAIYVGAKTPGPASVTGLELAVKANGGSYLDFAINRLDLLR